MAYQFNGSNQDLTTASTPVTTRPLTISCLFYTGSTSIHSLVSVERSGEQHAYNIRVNGQKLIATLFNGAADNLTGATNYSLNSWQHACCVWASASRKVYLNGTEDASDANATNPVQTVNRISVGSRTNVSPGLYFNGQLAEVGIWNTDLTAAEIASLADGMTCDKVRPQSLVFYAPLVRNLQDLSRGLTITNNNTATVASHPRVYA